MVPNLLANRCFYTQWLRHSVAHSAKSFPDLRGMRGGILAEGWGYPILTDAIYRAAKSADMPYKLSDAFSLYLYVAISSDRSRRWKYRIGDREKVLTIGFYPDVSLS